MSRIAGLVLALLTIASVARAEDVVFPPGSRIGLAPPPGFTASRTFAGFESAVGASILFVEMPAGAFDEVRRGMTVDGLAQKGMRWRGTESIGGLGFETLALRAEQRVGEVWYDKWVMVFDAKALIGMVVVTVPKSSPPRLQDATIRAALASVKVHAEPNGDAMAALPFTVEPAARFTFRAPLAGRGLILKETPPPPEGRSDDLSIIVVLASEAPVAVDDQKDYGAQQFLSMKSLTDQAIESARPIEVAGIHGFEYLGPARSAKTGQPRRIIFVVLYPAGRPFILQGTAPPDKFDGALPDFRAVIDSFRPKS